MNNIDMTSNDNNDNDHHDIIKATKAAAIVATASHEGIQKEQEECLIQLKDLENDLISQTKEFGQAYNLLYTSHDSLTTG